ncbi:MFS general substrate transporter [Auriculariales sp. MPI-PUGE-AT-0066]|nr:MFS general substrate transporter [Auriculariales sp. MPI-PUGE-AT-0066]
MFYFRLNTGFSQALLMYIPSERFGRYYGMPSQGQKADDYTVLPDPQTLGSLAPSPPPMNAAPAKLPWAWEQRSSVGFITFVVTLGGAVDLLVYGLVIPIVPFRLQELGYDHVAAKSGWLLFAFSLSLILTTPVISWWSEKYKSRRSPLVVGMLALMGAQACFMESTTFWMMVVARIIQGASSTVVWVVALALLCDTVPSQHIGRYMGIAMTGYSTGLIISTPLSGLLYGALGYRAPFVFGMIVAFVDLLARLLVIEKAEADAIRSSITPPQPPDTSELHVTENTAAGDEPPATLLPLANDTAPRMPAWKIWRELGFSRRPIAVFVLTLVYGLVITALEPTAPLRLKDVWGLDATKVGVVFLASTAPSLISGPLTGWLADRYGAALVAAGCILLAAPWLYPLTLVGNLATFIASLLFTMFFESGLVTPITVETAMLTEGIPGLGYADTFGVFNIAYGSGSMLGPIIGGQLYDGHSNGWMVVCAVLGGLLAVGLSCTAAIGDRPFAMVAYRSLFPKVTKDREMRELQELRAEPNS